MDAIREEDVMAIFRWTWDPWRDLRGLREDVERAFGRFGRDLGVGKEKPAVNVYQDDEGLTVTAEVPGVKAGDLAVEAEGDALTITARRAAPEGIEDSMYHRREREFGEFSRELKLPAGLDTEKVVASLADGLLTVRLPKAETAKPRKIEVRAG